MFLKNFHSGLSMLDTLLLYADDRRQPAPLVDHSVLAFIRLPCRQIVFGPFRPAAHRATVKAKDETDADVDLVTPAFGSAFWTLHVVSHCSAPYQ